LDLIVSVSETVELALTEIQDDDKTAACVHGPGSSGDLVLGVRRVAG
jgi:hypothetical protein